MKPSKIIFILLLVNTPLSFCPIAISTPMDRAYAALNRAKTTGTFSSFSGALDTIESELGGSVGNRNLTLLALDAAAQQSAAMSLDEKSNFKIKVQETMNIGQSDTQRQLIAEVIEGIQGPIAKERNTLVKKLEAKDNQIDQLNQQTQQLVQARLYDEQGIKLLKECSGK